MVSGKSSSSRLSWRKTNYHHPFVFATPLFSVFEPPGRLSIMTEAPLKKRDRESQALLYSIDVGSRNASTAKKPTGFFTYCN
jgi:hypothetical protein